MAVFLGPEWEWVTQTKGQVEAICSQGLGSDRNRGHTGCSCTPPNPFRVSDRLLLAEPVWGKFWVIKSGPAYWAVDGKVLVFPRLWDLSLIHRSKFPKGLCQLFLP